LGLHRHILDATTATVKPIGWAVIFAASVLALVAAIAGARVWRGLPINPRNTRAAEDKLAVLTVTLLPDSVVFFCWALIGLVSQAGAGKTGSVAVVFILAEVVIGAASLIAFGVAVSLFFTWRPKRFLPPHLRTHSRAGG